MATIDSNQGPDNAPPTVIESPFTIYAVEELQAQLKERLSKSEGLVLDLGSVPTCDVAGLQLLCAARKSARIAGQHFHITNYSPAISAAMGAIGMDPSELAEINL